MRRLQHLTLMTLLLVPVARAGDADGACYEKALDFLISQQREDGSWGAMGQPTGELGITALVVRGLAGAPEALQAKARPAAEKGAASLLAAQQADGSFTQERSGLTTYRTSLSLMALTALDRDRYAEPIAKAVAWLQRGQLDAEEQVSEDSPHYGGFGYDHAGEKPNADLSNTHLALAALRDAGIGPDDPVYQRALTFLSRCQNSSETNKGVGKLRPLDDGGFFYDPGLSTNKSAMIENEDGTQSFVSYASMTYAGLLSLVYAGLDEGDARVQAALGWIKENYTLEENRGLGVRAKDPNAAQQGLFYYFHSFAKCLAAVGKPTVETAQGPRHWARDLYDVLEARQGEDGSFRNANDRWWEQDPVLVTGYVLNAMNYARPFLPK